MDLDKFKSNGKFLMLALDHRGSFKKLINPQNPETVSDQEAIDLKVGIIKSLEDQFSGLLIDTQYGLPAYMGGNKPFLLPVEKSGFVDDEGERITEIEYSVVDLMQMNASGTKLLLYLNPHLPSATLQLETAKKVINDCKNHDFPLFVEIVTYEPDIKEQNVYKREELVLESLDLFIESGVLPDVFKLEYPGSAAACGKVTQKIKPIPWILLTRGDSFDHFQNQLKEAIEGGAQGFLAGRALWQEVCRMDGQQKEKFLKEVLPERFKIVAQIASNK